MEDGLLDEEFFIPERRLSEVWQAWKTELIRRPSEARLKEPQKLTRRPHQTRLKECRFCTHPDPYQQPHPWPIAVKLLTNHSQLEHTGFEGISPLCPSLPGKAIKLSFSTAPKTLYPRCDLAQLYRQGLSWWWSGKKPTWQCRRRRRGRVGKIPWKRKWKPTRVFLPG